MVIDGLSRNARRRPEGVALVEGVRRLTHGDLDREATALACRLRASGVASGDRVVVLGRTSIPIAVAFWAVLRAGAVAVVVNDTTWHAIEAARGVKVTWSIPGAVAELSDATILATAQSLMTGAAAAVAEANGDSAATFASAPLQFSQTYSVPYLAHATLEPLNCTASVTATSCEIWAPTQAAGLVAATAASITGLPANKITVHTTFLGGGLGRKFEQDFIAQAIQVSKAVQQPVKLVWSREEDFTNDQYRPMALARVQAGLDSQGNVYITHQGVGKQMDTVLVFDPKGKFVRSFGKEWHGGGHGIQCRFDARGNAGHLDDEDVAADARQESHHGCGRNQQDHVRIEIEHGQTSWFS